MVTEKKINGSTPDLIIVDEIKSSSITVRCQKCGKTETISELTSSEKLLDWFLESHNPVIDVNEWERQNLSGIQTKPECTLLVCKDCFLYRRNKEEKQ